MTQLDDPIDPSLSPLLIAFGAAKRTLLTIKPRLLLLGQSRRHYQFPVAEKWYKTANPKDTGVEKVGRRQHNGLY